MPERSVTVRIAATDNFSAVMQQYQSKMDAATRVTRDMGAATDTTATKTDNLGKIVQGVFSVAVITKVAEMGAKVYELGIGAEQTEARFEALTRSLGESEDIMANMRDATLGMATDMELQANANRLLQLRIATSNEELAQFMSIASALKQPTDSLTDSLENMALMIANQSYLRLDSLGISASATRDRVKELKDELGVDKETAFRMAFLEQAQVAVDNLGDSATVSSTAVGRLTTEARNIAEDIAQEIALVIEGAATTVEMAVQIPELQRQHAIQEAEVLAGDMAIAMSNAMSNPDVTGGEGDANFIEDFLRRSLQAARENPELQNDAIALRDEVLAQFGVMNPEGAMGSEGALAGYADQINALAEIATLTVVERDKAIEIANEQERAAEAQERMAEAAAEAEAAVKLLNEQMAAAENHARDLHKLQALSNIETDAIATAFENMSTFTFDQELPEFMTQEQADRIGDMADEAERIAEQIALMDEANPDLFTDEEVANAQATAENVQKIADDAAKAAEAFANISLSDIFKQGGGGALGEISDMVLEQFAAAGGTEEQQAALQRELDLASGRQTLGSEALTMAIIPELAALGEDPELVAAIATQIRDILAQAALQGVDPNSPEFQQLFQSEAFSGEGGAFNPENLMAFSAEEFVAYADAMINAEEPVGAMEQNLVNYNDQMIDLNGHMDSFLSGISGVNERFGLVEASTEKIAGNLQALTSKVNVVRVRLDVELTGDDLDGLVRSAVVNNGGAVPGAVS